METTPPGIAHLLSVDPSFAAIVSVSPPFDEHGRGQADYFNALIRGIVGQQLATRAAASIHRRFLELFEGGPPTPAAVLSATEIALRGVGLSNAKFLALRDLALKVTDGTVPLERIEELDDDEIVRRLSTVRGIGRWTAEMFLIFQLGRPDVWPVDDLGVRRGYAAIHGLAEWPAPKALQALGDIYRPHRTTAAWYCWRTADNVVTPG